MEFVPAGAVRLVVVSAPSSEAQGLARHLVEASLAGCVNVVPGVRSVYRWQGTLHDEAESLLLIKTAAHLLPALGKALHEQHPYEVPEVLVLGPEAGSAPYLAWLAGALPPAPEAAPPAPRGGVAEVG